MTDYQVSKLAMRWMRAREGINAELEQLESVIHAPEPPFGYTRDYLLGKHSALFALKARYFLTDDEEREVWAARKEMGF